MYIVHVHHKSNCVLYGKKRKKNILGPYYVMCAVRIYKIVKRTLIIGILQQSRRGFAWEAHCITTSNSKKSGVTTTIPCRYKYKRIRCNPSMHSQIASNSNTTKRRRHLSVQTTTMRDFQLWNYGDAHHPNALYTILPSTGCEHIFKTQRVLFLTILLCR